MLILLTILSSSVFCLTPSLKNLGASCRGDADEAGLGIPDETVIVTINDEMRSHQKGTKGFQM